MIDLDNLRQNPDLYRNSLQVRQGRVELVDKFLEQDRSWRELVGQVDRLRSERKALASNAETAKQNAEQLKQLKLQLEELETKLSTSEQARRLTGLALPNLIDSEVPIGEGESANKVIKQAGEIKLKTGTAHEELLAKLDWLDEVTAGQYAGARYRYLLGPMARAEMKLMHTALDLATQKGFTAIIPPVIARDQTMEKAGFFPFGQEDTFRLDDEHYLIGSSEAMLVALGAELAKKQTLPIRLVGFSSCFRKEAGSYGKDVKGMFRQHQFDKVEMVVICRPEDSAKEHELLVQTQEELVSQFNLPYQLVLIGSGDLEAKAVKRIDLETWFPGQQKYRETHSASNCTDFQARRFGIKDQNGNYLHTLNATLATERLLLAICENNQTPDGQVALPASLG